MTTLRPTRYADRDNSTFFETAGDLISFRYTATQRKRLLLLPGPARVRIEASFGGGAPSITHEYEVPADFRVGSEIGRLERGLYGFMDQVVRTAVQRHALSQTERAIESAESRHLFELESQVESALDRPKRADLAPAEVRAVLDELVERVITAVRHLTNVTSLNRDGLQAYQQDRTEALDRVLESTSLSSSLRVQEILTAVESLLSHEIGPQTDVNALRETTRRYLARLARQGEGAPKLTEEQAHIIANEFVPSYVELNRKYDAAGAFPGSIVEHAFGSFFGGGIAGWLTLSLFGEAVIRGLFGVYVDIPGWYVGAAVAFVWPYLRGAYGLATREGWYEQKREALFQKVVARLRLSWPEDSARRSLSR